MTASKIKPLLSELETQYQNYLQKAKTFSQELQEKYAIEDKIAEIKPLLEKLKKKKLS
ncbi:MAG: hypothetical protein H6765_01430 [Candidatus Peribacteria bacterium]|nr:MAG: hypothetical protein H6765_01430 [Candidatus Peribacteria bacterium]